MSILKNGNSFLIFGIGRTGISVLDFLNNNAFDFHIYDDNQAILKSFNIDESKKLYKIESIAVDFIVLSPGIKIDYENHPLFKVAKRKNIKIISDFDIFFEFLNKNKFNFLTIGITGTNGKSTSVSLINYILNASGLKSFACGNIGNPVLCTINQLQEKDQTYYFVIECSSYQLNISNVAFDYSVLLNVQADHIDYHSTMQKYVSCKKKIFHNTKYAAISFDDKYCKSIFNQLLKNLDSKNIIKFSQKKITKCDNQNVFYINNDKIYFNNQDLDISSNFDNLIGKHNIQNILAALSLSHLIGLDIQYTAKIIRNFKNLEHRLEFVMKFNNIAFINDSKATNATSTLKALEYAFAKYDDICLIAGGRRKTDGFLYLQTFFNRMNLNNFFVFLIGESQDSLAEELNFLSINYVKSDNMQKAITLSYEHLIKKQTKNKLILLSPLCASFDQYNSFEKRGEDFKKLSICIKEKENKAV
jgi:UDP-N-acetylmuramoylalanine--D-glutamate ligase